MSSMNILEIDGQRAVIGYDPGTNSLRGEFIGLNGGADFYGASIDELMAEGRRSLVTFLEVCAENGIEPYRSYSGKFQVRIPEDLHARAAAMAAARGVSLNQLVAEAVEHEAA